MGAGTPDLFEAGLFGWCGADCGSETRPVGLLEPNALGPRDMTGDAWEWYGRDDCARSPVLDPTGPPFGTRRAQRGGSCHRVAAECRTTFRLAHPPGARSRFVGLRVALSPPWAGRGAPLRGRAVAARSPE